MTPTPIAVGLIFGGASGEHAVSIRSAATVAAAMRDAENASSYALHCFYIDPEGRWWGAELADAVLLQGSPARLEQLPQPLPPPGFRGLPAGALEIDVWLPVLHGPNGDDGTIQGLVTLMQAAHFTTRNQTVLIVRALLENDLWDAMREDPTLIPAAVEEGMRYYPVVLGVTRAVGAEGVRFGGIDLPVGTSVRWNPMGATRDPEFFTDPYRFDLARDTTGRISFGHGLHRCLGHAMARADMEIAIDVLTQRLRRPVISRPPKMVATGLLWGAEALHLRFDT